MNDLPPISGARVRAEVAGAGDAPALQAVLDAVRDYYVLTEGVAAPPDAARELVAETEADETRRVFLLRGASGPPLGFLDLHLHQPEPGVAHVGVLALRPEARGRGVGGELVEALAAALAAAGFAALRCSVGDENPEARAFWERVGFAEVGRLDGGVTVLERTIP
ncbi:MAG TPA: GNAT family N-acetyltransferase [Anaeromyxobacter sp.]|nr:GNAT family N-acetyltransferase [Anaeromyxobacter sp.]